MRRTTSIKKVNLLFTYESRDTLMSFTMFISVKDITKLNLGHIDKSEIKIKKSAVGVHVLQTTQNLVILRSCFAEDGKEMYQEL